MGIVYYIVIKIFSCQKKKKNRECLGQLSLRAARLILLIYHITNQPFRSILDRNGKMGENVILHVNLLTIWSFPSL